MARGPRKAQGRFCDGRPGRREPLNFDELKVHPPEWKTRHPVNTTGEREEGGLETTIVRGSMLLRKLIPSCCCDLHSPHERTSIESDVTSVQAADCMPSVISRCLLPCLEPTRCRITHALIEICSKHQQGDLQPWSALLSRNAATNASCWDRCQGPWSSCRVAALQALSL